MAAVRFPASSMPDADWWQALWPDPAAVLSRLEMPPARWAIDLCCGDGLFTLPLAGAAAEVIAIDLDPAMLHLAQARLAGSAIANAFFVAGDAYDLARFLGVPSEFVLMANTFHGVPEKGRLARAVASVLAPGGRFAVINWHRRPREQTVVLGRPRGPATELRMTPAELAETLAPAGFRCARLIELPPYHYAGQFTIGRQERIRAAPSMHG